MKKNNKILLYVFLSIVVVISCIATTIILTCTGFYIIQPIGAIPEGVVIWYIRQGINLRFIDSADGFLLRNEGGVSLFTRAITIIKIMQLIEDKIIGKFPYSEKMYLISTSGIKLSE